MATYQFNQDKVLVFAMRVGTEIVTRVALPTEEGERALTDFAIDQVGSALGLDRDDLPENIDSEDQDAVWAWVVGHLADPWRDGEVTNIQAVLQWQKPAGDRAELNGWR